MDCDDVVLLLANGGRTLTERESAQLADHVAGCTSCRALQLDDDDHFRWIARIPDDALDDGDLLVLPTVDPAVFGDSHELARGGMGRIARTHDRKLGRDVALKEVLDPAMHARFEREIAITAQLQHPAIVPIYEAGAWPDGTLFYTMRLVSGGTLGDAIGKARSLVQRLALLPNVIAMTEALAYAHSNRIVHRDLKPGNVLVGEFGETLVIDWGLAKDLRDVAADAERPSISPHLTMAGSVIGTPGFMSPEQAGGEPVDERTDVYSLGAILYTLLAGHPPHVAEPSSRVTTAVGATALAFDVPPEPLADDVPADLRAIVARAMALEPADRYPSAKEMADELHRFAAGQLLRSREYRVRDLIARWVRRHRAVVAVGAIAAAIIAVIGVTAVVNIARSRSAERDARHEAEHALAESQLEQGRQRLIDGHPDEAAPLIAAALAKLPGDRTARRLDTLASREAHRRLAQVTGSAAAFSADGAALAIGRADGSIVVLDATTGGSVRVLGEGGGAVADIAFAADGTRLLVATPTGVRLRDATTGATTATLSSTAAREARFVGSDRVAVATATSLDLIDVHGTPIAHLAGDHPESLAVSRDGTMILARMRASVIVANSSDLSTLAELPDHPYSYAASFAPDATVVVADAAGVARWSIAPVRQLASLPNAVTLAWLDDATLLADGHAIDLATGHTRELARDLPIRSTAVLDREHAITGGYDRMIRIWDVDRGTLPLVAIEASTVTARFAVASRGGRVASIGDGEHAPVELWDVSALRGPTTLATVPGDAQYAIIDHAGRLAVRWHTATEFGTVLLSPSHQEIARLEGWPMAFRPGADEIITDIEGRLIVSSAIDGHRIREITGLEPLYHLAFSRDATRVAVSSNHRVELRDAATWEVLVGFDTPQTADITALALEGDRVVTGHQDGTMNIWDLRTGTIQRTMNGHTATVTQLDLRDGTIVSGSWDLTTRRWAFPSGESLGIVTNARQTVAGVAMSPDGELLAVADGSAALSLWDTRRGYLVQRIPTAELLSAVVFVDGDHVIVGGSGGRLELVDITP